MILTRVNPSGQFYKLFEAPGKKTLARCGNKELMLDIQIVELNQAWFNWTQKGMFVQDAFKRLPEDQREFLMTGITPDEWNSMIANDEA